MKEKSFFGTQGYSTCKMILDLENKDLHFYIAEGEAMKEVDYQEFLADFHSQAWQCIESDNLRNDYIEFSNSIREFVNKYCEIVGC